MFRNNAKWVGVGAIALGLAAPFTAQAHGDDEAMAFIVGAAVGYAIGDDGDKHRHVHYRHVQPRHYDRHWHKHGRGHGKGHERWRRGHGDGYAGDRYAHDRYRKFRDHNDGGHSWRHEWRRERGSYQRG